MSIFDRIQNKMFGLDDPNSPKCCFCFPLKCGIYFIGVMAVMDFSYEISRTALMAEHFSVVIGILTIPCLLFMVTNISFHLLYCFRDSARNRRFLVQGCSLQITANILILFGWILASIFVEGIGGSLLLQMIITYTIQILCWFYFRMVCSQWVSLGDQSE